MMAQKERSNKQKNLNAKRLNAIKMVVLHFKRDNVLYHTKFNKIILPGIVFIDRPIEVPDVAQFVNTYIQSHRYMTYRESFSQSLILQSTKIISTLCFSFNVAMTFSGTV